MSPETRRKKRNSTVVKKPPVKSRVPVNSFVRSVEPSAGGAAFVDVPVAPKSSTCCKNICTVLIGARIKLSRSSSRGMPSGSLEVQVRAGPEMAVPKPIIVPNRAMISSSDAIVRGKCRLTNSTLHDLVSRKVDETLRYASFTGFIEGDCQFVTIDRNDISMTKFLMEYPVSGRIRRGKIA
jgi:hypothetical protein